MKRSAMIVFLMALWVVAALPSDPNPTDPAQLKRAEALFNKGVKAFEAKKLDEAEGLFNQAIAAYPLLPGAYVELGKVQMSRNDPAKALEYYLKAHEIYLRVHDLKIKDQTKQTTADREYVQAGTDSGTGAVGGFAKQEASKAKDQRMVDKRDVVAADSDSEADIPALYYLYLSGAYLRLNQSDPAEKAILTGLKKDEKLAPLHFNLAVIYLGQGKYQESAYEARLARKHNFPLPPAFIKDLETRGNLKF